MSETVVDVLVAGGGTAGTIAGIQAARAGARTLMVEASGMLGGTGTVAGVAFPGLFHAHGRQVIAGIGWDLVRQAVAESGLRMPDFSDAQISRSQHWRHQVPLVPAIYAAIAEQAFLSAGGQLLFHTMLGALSWSGSEWRATICCREGLRQVIAKVVIDATGDANAAGMAGLEREIHDPPQPGTQMYHISGYDFGSLNIDAIERNFERAVEAGELLRSDMHSARHVLLNRGDNSNHILGARGETSEAQTRANLDGRACLRRVLKFLRRQPGLESLRVDCVATMCGVRQGKTIVGKTRITMDDYLCGKLWPDAVCNSYYPIDLHRPDGVSGVHIVYPEEGMFATIPLGAMIPRNHRRMLVAGQCISGDQLAHSAYRVQSTCMATGQAAGATAALACAKDADVDAIPLKEIHDLLAANDAILPGQTRETA